MANSINTNYGAAIALQNLNNTNAQLQTTQNRINTGQKVSSAKDNGAIFAIATSQRANMGAQDAVKNSLQRGQSVIDVALAAGDTAVSALQEMKALAVNIASSSGDAQAAYLADWNALGKEVDSALKGASFDGVNLWNTTTATNVTTSTASTGNTYQIGFGTTDKAAATAITDITATAAAPTDAATTAAFATKVDAAIKAMTTDMATLGTQSKSVGRTINFVGKLQDALESGVGNLVDADLAKESAKLTALQTKQQLGVQALSIANSSSSILLGLFR
ncbi:MULTISPECIES: flagellin [unclassified Brevundimonas]|uniref:flagellin N-terminal helical domain-containing protein n=1 Tax=unclassified Brevundimonas TaxID=2622653 RepID=UPI0020056281|nr:MULTISPECIES: flagellin [unclassified Brevundimonas]MCK6105106.1 flagellin [Brevundimonas sp. EYE_349]